jgi:hypothetical protein
MKTTAVLVSEKSAPIRLLKIADLPQLGSFPLKSAISYDLARCLPLFGPNAATPFANWCQLDDPSSIPGFDWFPRGGSALGELRTTKAYPFVPESRLLPILEAYKHRSLAEKDLIAIGLSRFSQAMRRQKVEDQAIELRIALEALLAKDRDPQAPITHLIKQRGALVLGASPSERATIAAQLGKAYAATSEAVHTGSVKSEKQKAAIRIGMGHCAELLKRFILTPPPADWDEVVFSSPVRW